MNGPSPLNPYVESLNKDVLKRVDEILEERGIPGVSEQAQEEGLVPKCLLPRSTLVNAYLTQGYKQRTPDQRNTVTLQKCGSRKKPEQEEYKLPIEIVEKDSEGCHALSVSIDVDKEGKNPEESMCLVVTEKSPH